MSTTEPVWESHEDGTVTITLKPSGGHEVPWIVLRYKSVGDALAAFTKDGGADLMQLFRNVCGAQKSLDQTYNNREAPPAKTQGKPAAASQPSPQVEVKADPFAPVDDAPPFADQAPQCKHGARVLKPYKGQNYWVCGSDLPQGDSDRCQPEVR